MSTNILVFRTDRVGDLLLTCPAFLSIKKNFQLVLVSNKPVLLNYYGVIPISKKKCPNAKLGLAEIFIEWLTSREGQEGLAIG